MSVKEISYPIKACPFCGYSAEAKECSVLCSKGWIIQCTKCHIKTIPVLIDSPCIDYTGKLREETRYDYYGALKVVTDVWNKRVND